MIISQKYKASEQATRFLMAQIEALRTEIEQGEVKLAEYGSSRNITPPVGLGSPHRQQNGRGEQSPDRRHDRQGQ